MPSSLAKTLVLWSALSFAPLVQAADYLEFQDWSLNWGHDSSVDMPGRLYVPTNYNPSQKYPLVIFMHGGGETGTNNQAQLDAVSASLIPKIKARGWFMYAAQVENNSSWYDANLTKSLHQVAYALAKYNIDPTRIYVTGFSLGGGGTKMMLRMYARAVGAAMPVCATFDSDYNYIPPLVNKPIWAFHGELDNSVGPNASRNFMSALITATQNAGNTPPALNVAYTGGYYHYNWNNILRYTEFKGDGHGIWTRVYREDDSLGIYDWLASKASDITQNSLRVGESAYFNVGDYQSQTTDSQGRVWNIVQGWGPLNTRTGLVPFAKNSAGVTTLLSLSVLETGNNGFMSVADGLARPGYDDIFARDGWYWSGTQSTWKIHGLIPGGTYAVEAYASGSASTTGTTRYTLQTTLSGSTSSQVGDLAVFNNTSGSAVLFNATAGDDGALLLKIAPTPGGNRAQINTLRITCTGTSAAPGNLAPVVDAGSNQTTTLYDGVVLSGTASDDGQPSGSSLSVAWSKDSGPGSVTFSNGTSLSTSASFSDPGTYVLKLTASDSALSGSDTVTITVNEWKNVDIGTVPVAGSGVVTSGTVVLTGSGDAIWNNTDDFHFLFRPVSGDCTIIARQLSHPYQHWSSKAGIMIRGSLGRDATHCFLGMLPGGGNSIYMRHQQGNDWAESGESIGLVPYWLKLVRVGNTIECYLSPDGVTWVQTKTYSFSSLPATMYVGFATCSGAPYTLTSVFDNITVAP